MINFQQNTEIVYPTEFHFVPSSPTVKVGFGESSSTKLPLEQSRWQEDSYQRLNPSLDRLIKKFKCVADH